MVSNLYIFIGPDLCGKTEISTNLASLFGWQYYKNKQEFSRFTDETYDAKASFRYETPIVLNFLTQCDFRNNGVVLDRGIPCEYAYAKALSRDFDEELIWKFDEAFAKLDAKLILCYKTSYKNFEDEYVTEDIQANVLEYYREYLTKTKMKHIELCTDSEDLVEEFAQIFKTGIIFDDYDDETEE